MDAAPLSRLCRNVLSRIAGEKHRPFVKLYQSWQEVVGELLASRSHPYRYHTGILYVAVHNSSWMQELVLRKTDILSRCRSIIPDEIRDIIFLIHK